MEAYPCHFLDCRSSLGGLRSAACTSESKLCRLDGKQVRRSRADADRSYRHRGRVVSADQGSRSSPCRRAGSRVDSNCRSGNRTDASERHCQLPQPQDDYRSWGIGATRCSARYHKPGTGIQTFFGNVTDTYHCGTVEHDNDQRRSIRRSGSDRRCGRARAG